MQVTFIDGIVLFVLLFYAAGGYATGAIVTLLDIGTLVISFVVSLTFYTRVSMFFSSIFSLSQGVSHALSFFVIACVVELFLHIILKIPRNTVMSIISTGKPLVRKTNKFLGILLGGIQAGAFLAFFLTLLLLFPVSIQLKQSITSSFSAQYLLLQTQFLEHTTKHIFGGAASDMLTFLTVEEDSKTLVKLHFIFTEGTIAPEDEKQMAMLINKERKKNNKAPLIYTTGILQDVARGHGKDMLQRGYFSHYTLEGLSPFDRMEKASITYAYAGENLAFSPSVDLAMHGLMNSTGHRANILSPLFHHVGIGVIDGGKYGKMFVQEFTD